MPSPSLRDRVAALEAEVAQMKKKLEAPIQPSVNHKRDWLDVVAGSFANDPLHEEAMQLGRQWRESFRPKPRNRKKRSK